MHLFVYLRLICLAFLSLSVYAQRGRGGGDEAAKAEQSRVIGLTRPSPTDGRRPLQTENWISPEYKWFFEYPLPLPPVKSKKS